MLLGLGNAQTTRMLPVKVGERVGTMWIIEGGVKAGDVVIVEGLQKVRDGSPVKIKQSSPAKGN